MKLILTCVLLLLLVSGENLYAQLQGRPIIDSLLRELPKQKEDTIKVNVLLALSYWYINTNPAEGVKCGKQGLALAEKLNWKPGEEWTYFQIGSNYKIKLDYPNAFEYLFKALNVAEDIKDKELISRVCYIIGDMYLILNDYAKELEYSFKSLKLFEEEEDKRMIATLYNNIGVAYKQQSQPDYPEALAYFYKCIKIDSEMGDVKGTALAYSNIGEVYIGDRKYVTALRNLDTSLKLAEKTADDYTKAWDLCDVGTCYLSILKDQVHIYELDGTITISKEAMLDSSIVYFIQALKISKNLQRIDLIQLCYENLATAYKLRRDYGKSLEAYENYTTIKDSIFSRENDKKILHRQLQYDYDKREDSIKFENAKRRDSIRFENDKKELALQKEMQLNALKYEYQKKQAAAKSEEEKQQLAYEEELKRKEMNYEYEQKRLTMIAEQKNSKLIRDKKEAITAKELQKQKLVRNGFMCGFAAVLLFAGVFFSQRNKIKRGKEKSDDLLLNILPSQVAEELKAKGTANARLFDNVTVLFTDFVNFTSTSEHMNPQTLIDELHNCFKAFDGITTKYGVEKIKTIGDAYLAIGGLPTADPKHAENVVMAAKEISVFMQDRYAKLGNKTFEIRMGVHSGSVVAGIVGVKKFQYDIWGDAVNTAARMEQNSEAGKINISETTYELVKDQFACEYRGEIEAKGKGAMKMYYVGWT